MSTDVGVTTYNGLESCIFNSSSCDEDSGISATTGVDGCVTTDSLEDEVSSCSSSKDVYGSSFSSQCLPLSKQEEHSLYELDTLDSVHLLPIKGKNPITYTLSASDIETMKEKFARLLLGDDVSGGARGVCAALALSNGITNLSGILVHSSANYAFAYCSFPLMPPTIMTKLSIYHNSHYFWRAVEAGTTMQGEKDPVAEGNGLAAFSYNLHGRVSSYEAKWSRWVRV
jgi:hypothetical protein